MLKRLSAFLAAARAHPWRTTVAALYGLLLLILKDVPGWVLDKIWGEDIFRWLRSPSVVNPWTTFRDFVAWSWDQAADRWYGLLLTGFLLYAGFVMTRMWKESRPGTQMAATKETERPKAKQRDPEKLKKAVAILLLTESRVIQ